MRKAIPFSALLVLLGLLVVQIGCSKDEDPVTPPPACSITLTTPKANDSFFTDDEINIRWDRATGENVRISLYKGGIDIGTIKADHTNTGTAGFFPWLNPETFDQDSGEDYSIKVASLQNPDCFDLTENFEMIDVSNCFLKFPWKLDLPDQIAGNTFQVIWESAHTSGFVDLELWLDPFMEAPFKVEDLALNLEDTGSFSWTVDSYNVGTKSGFFFKITDVSAHRCTDSSVPFTIIDDVICTIEVSGISKDRVYNQGEVIPITFPLENSSGFVDLTLYSGNDPVDSGIIVKNFDTDNGTLPFNWTVTDFGHPGPSFVAFNIRVVDSNDDNCKNKSENFTIAQ